jgi:hypothetical protein
LDELLKAAYGRKLIHHLIGIHGVQRILGLKLGGQQSDE